MSKPQYPEYPCLEESEYLEVYKNLTDNDEYRDWFVNDNQSMYEQLKMYKQIELHYALNGYDSDFGDIIDDSTEDLFVEVFIYGWDYIKEIDYTIKQWFETNERIKRYEEQITTSEKNPSYFSDSFRGFNPSCKFVMKRFLTHQYRFTDSSDESSDESYSWDNEASDDSSESEESSDD